MDRFGDQFLARSTLSGDQDVGFGGSDLLYISTILLTVIAMYVNFFNRISYNEHLSTTVFRQSLIQTFFNHLSSLFLISQVQLGILGRQLGQIIAFSMNAGFYTRKLRKSGYLELERVFRIDMLRRVFYFAIPAFSTTIIVATLSYVDRIFLNYFHGAQEVGIFSLGYMIGQGFTFITDAVSMALLPSLMKELENDYEANLRKLKHFDLMFIAGMAALSVAAFLFKDTIVHVLSNKSYSHAAEVLPFIMFAFVLGASYKTVSNVLSFHNIVRFYPALSIVSFGVTACANYLLIPRFHELGAGYAFFIGVFIYSLIIQLIGGKYFYNRGKVALIFGVVFVAVTYLFLSMTNIL